MQSLARTVSTPRSRSKKFRDGTYDGDRRVQAAAQARRFFQGLRTPQGLPVDVDRLLTEENVDLLLSTDDPGKLAAAHEMLGTCLGREDARRLERAGMCDDHVKRLLAMVRRCKTLRIPKVYHSGLIVLWLEVEKSPVPTWLRKSNSCATPTSGGGCPGK